MMFNSFLLNDLGCVLANIAIRFLELAVLFSKGRWLDRYFAGVFALCKVE